MRIAVYANAIARPLRQRIQVTTAHARCETRPDGKPHKGSGSRRRCQDMAFHLSR